ncbi:glutathione S-transferase family protein [Faunimonas sp. B44]|uniref:glutathione S-transferase family protein n=1 Tax=Faunimonas sp. B44 TaxID=3461493 RepID=UPI004043A9C3
MGMMVDGIWRSDVDRVAAPDGQFVRPQSRFRNWITPDGRPGPSGAGGFPAEPGRYHLYVSYACPWAHRTLLYRSLLGLDSSIGVSVVHPVNIVEGWDFSDFPGSTGDRLHGAGYLHELYARVDPAYSGRVSVPVLWDAAAGTIVNNESSEIIRMLGANSEALGGRPCDYRPPALEGEIDQVNEIVYAVNNGVYRCGFAKSQAAYDAAAERLFGALDALEARLGRSEYLVGDRVTESDWRLLPTALRFDPVYVVHFKCSRRLYAEYPNLQRHMMRLVEAPGVRETIRLDHIRHHYFRSHLNINPHGIIPVGPRMPWEP